MQLRYNLCAIMYVTGVYLFYLHVFICLYFHARKDRWLFKKKQKN